MKTRFCILDSDPHWSIAVLFLQRPAVIQKEFFVPRTPGSVIAAPGQRGRMPRAVPQQQETFTTPGSLQSRSPAVGAKHPAPVLTGRHVSAPVLTGRHVSAVSIPRSPVISTSPRGKSSAAKVEIPDGCDFSCDRCSKTFKTSAGLNMHMQQHTGKWSFWCEPCQRGFTVKCNYTAHLAKHEGRTFPCDLCPKRFGTKFGLKQHQSEHTGKYIYYCKVCSKGYNQKLHWEEHENRHENIKYSCRYCQQDYFHEYMRSRHEKNCANAPGATQS